MDNKKSFNKKGQSFKSALLLILGITAVSILAFLNEDTKITGQVISSDVQAADQFSGLKEFSTIHGLNELAAGTYFIDASGIVYWKDDPSNPAVAKVQSLSDFEKGRMIFVDKDGNVGFLVSEQDYYN